MAFGWLDKKTFVLLLLFSLVAAQAVAAQNIADTLSNIPVLNGIDGARLEQLYDDFWWLWDLIVYSSILGIGLKAGAMKSGAFVEGGGKNLAMILAIVLGVAAVISENAIVFNLKAFGPLALTIALFMLGLYLWQMVGNMGLGKNSRIVFSLLFIAIYSLTSKHLEGLRNAIGYMNLIPSVLDILFAVFIVLLAIDVFSLIKGLFGKGGGGGPSGWFSGFGDSQERKKEEAAETGEKAQETNEEKEEKKISALIDRVSGIEKRNYKDTDRITKDVDELIKLLESNKRDQKVVEAIQDKLRDISLSEADVKQITVTLKTTVDELEKFQKAEVKNATDAVNLARTLAQTELKVELHVATLSNADTTKLTLMQTKLETDINARAIQQWAFTRKSLEAHILKIEQLEKGLPDLFNQAAEYLRMPGRIQSAISELKGAKVMLKQIRDAIAYLEHADIGTLKKYIRSELKELQEARRVADMLKSDFRKP